jgi:superfamily II DNA/RNA helicase
MCTWQTANSFESVLIRSQMQAQLQQLLPENKLACFGQPCQQSLRRGLRVQVVEVVAGDLPKEQWLMGRIAEFIDRGDVLVFANQKTRVDMLCDKLKAAGIK